jgi:predicted acetyltransferase
MSIEYRTGIDPTEYADFCRSLGVAFGWGTPESLIDVMRPIAEPDRMVVALERGRIVGGVTAASLEFTVPGDRSVAAAALNGVGVLPTHTRQGINTELMSRQLTETIERGESLAMLFASEGGIYGRYGYGLGSMELSFNLDPARSAFVRGYQPSGRVRLVEGAAVNETILEVSRGAWSQRPGSVRLDERWIGWHLGDLNLFPGRDLENEPLFCAVHVDDDARPTGMCLYRIAHRWTDRAPASELVVEDLWATTPEAEAALWRYVFDTDLIASVSSERRPVDDPLLHLLVEPRRLKASVSDGLWVRLADVPAALQARDYAADGHVVIEVDDRFCPWNTGRYVLTVDAGRATCERTDAAPDLSCSVNALGAIYLGGTTFSSLRRSLRVREVAAGAVQRADRMFASEPAPWCQLPF